MCWRPSPWTRRPATSRHQLAQKYADLVYNGQWFTPLREALDAFVDKTQETVTGDVKLKLYKGNIINAGVTSPYTLYDEQTATFGEDRRLQPGRRRRLHQPVRPVHPSEGHARQEAGRK